MKDLWERLRSSLGLANRREYNSLCARVESLQEELKGLAASPQEGEDLTHFYNRVYGAALTDEQVQTALTYDGAAKMAELKDVSPLAGRARYSLSIIHEYDHGSKTVAGESREEMEEIVDSARRENHYQVLSRFWELTNPDSGVRAMTRIQGRLLSLKEKYR